MKEESNFEISESIKKKMLDLKKKMGYEKNSWNDWFEAILNLPQYDDKEQSQIERIYENLHYKKNYEEWVQNFALNLPDIWNELSARELTPEFEPLEQQHSAIVIGAGPSLKQHNHLEILAKSDYNGSIICTDRSLVPEVIFRSTSMPAVMLFRSNWILFNSTPSKGDKSRIPV